MATAIARVALAAVLVVGCTLSDCTEFPRSAEAYRQQATAAGSVETFEASRPLRDVAATFRDRASSCLQDLVTTTVSGPTHRLMMTKNSFHPTVVVTDRKAELQVQMRPESGLQLVELPENGFLVLVAQASALDGRRTRIEIFGSSFFYSRLYTAVRGWAAGTSTACPDMS